MIIQQKKTKIPYTQEEKYAFFVEGKIKVSQPYHQKKKYNKSIERRKNKKNYILNHQ